MYNFDFKYNNFNSGPNFLAIHKKEKEIIKILKMSSALTDCLQFLENESKTFEHPYSSIRNAVIYLTEYKDKRVFFIYGDEKSYIKTVQVDSKKKCICSSNLMNTEAFVKID